MSVNVKVNENKSKVTILQKGAGKLKQGDFFYTIQEYINKGYALPLEPNNWDRPLRNFQGIATGRVVLYAEGKDPSLNKAEKVEKEVVEETPELPDDKTVTDTAEKEVVTPKVEDKPQAKKPSKATKKSK